MTRQLTWLTSRLSGYAAIGSLIVALGLLTTTFAQYQSGYPYSRSSAPSPQLPNSARHIGGFNGNPYTRSRAAPTGLPVSGNRQSYYGTTGRGNAFGHQAVSKPFSNLHRPQPLITSREAAKLEVARGLWHY